jgi:protein-L-isoaspartate O-methyltransferase
MQSIVNDEQALALLASVPRHAFVYSHLKYGLTVLDARLTAAGHAPPPAPSCQRSQLRTSGSPRRLVVRCAVIAAEVPA